MNKHGFDSIVVYSINAYSFFVKRKALENLVVRIF